MKTEMIPVKYARSTLPEKMIFTDGDANRNRKIISQIYLIKKGERLILVDAECETMPGFDMKDFVEKYSDKRYRVLLCHDE